MEHLAAMQERMTGFISGLTAPDLERAPAIEPPHPLFASLGSALALVSSHTAYHAGQIADLR
jgi:uncharacterized damage-inducible protein DinB